VKFDWNPDKNELLKSTRGISFELVVEAIKLKKVFVDTPHYNQVSYFKQRLMIVEINDYVYVVPYVLNGTVKFLKTIYPSRDYYKKYYKNAKKTKV